MTHVAIVSSDFYSSEDLAAALHKHGVTASCIYRDYNFNPSLEGVDVVVTDGTCKTGDGGGHSMPIRFDEPGKAAERMGKPCVYYEPLRWPDFADAATIEQRAQEVLAATKR